jgi:hypothetical protein
LDATEVFFEIRIDLEYDRARIPFREYVERAVGPRRARTRPRLHDPA